MSRLRAAIAVSLGVFLVAGCTSSDDPSIVLPTVAVTALPEGQTVVVEGADLMTLALATSRALFTSSPAVVLVGEDDPDAMEPAAQAAQQLGVPLLVTPAASPAQPTGASADPTGGASVAPVAQESGDASPVKAEIERLGAWAVVTSGAGAAAWVSSAGLAASITVSTVDGTAPSGVHPAPPLSTLTVLAVGSAIDAAAVATARAAGARVVELGASDPRATAESVEAVAAAAPEQVLALGSAFGPADRLRTRVDTAATGRQLPGGGQLLFPGRRMIALYGHPGDPVLGVLGEQGLEASVERARQLAASYESLVDEPVIPAFEIIVTVAAGNAGSDGNYSNEFPVEKFRPYVEAAQQAGIYVLLDLQPGRTDFLTQAKLYEELLLEPNVGLALDPEWRLKPDQVHLVQIGSVTAEEINQTGAWLDELVRANNLPQKVLMLHQFRQDMIINRPSLVTDYDGLRVVIHADGFGTQGAKLNTWNWLHEDEPDNILWGWKNFYDEDAPMATPAQTLAVAPDEIVFVSYQ